MNAEANARANRAEGRVIARNSVLLGAGEVTGLLLGLLTTILITDRLGSDYGLLLGAQRFVGLFLVIGQFGLYSLLVREVAVRRADAGALLGTALVLRAVLGAIFAVLVVIVAWTTDYLPEARWLVFAIVGIELLGLFTEAFIAALEGRERMGSSALVSATRPTITFLGLLVVIQLGAGVGGIAVAYAGSRTVQLGVAIFLTRRADRGSHISVRPALAARLMREALLFLGVSMCFTAMTTLDVVLLTKMSTTAQASWYGGALNFLDVLLLVPSFVQRALLPAFARLERDARGGSVASQTLRIFSAVLLPASVGLALIAPQAVALYPSGAFGASVPTLRLLAPVAYATGLAIVTAAFLTAAGRLRIIIAAYLIALAVQAAVSVTLVPADGAVGAATGRLAGHVVLTTLLLVAARSAGVAIPIGGFVRHAAATSAMAGILLALGEVSLWVAIAVGGTTYVLALAALLPAGALERRVVAAMLARLRRRRRSGRARILWVEMNEDGTVGGSHRALADLVGRLDRERFEPVVLAYQRSAFLNALPVERHFWDDRRVRENRDRGPGSWWHRLRGAVPAILYRASWLRAQGIDLVHLNNSPGIGWDDWLVAARLVGIPCVAHARGPCWRPRSRVGRALMRRFDRVIAVSQQMLFDSRAAGIPAERIRVIYDGVDATTLRARIGRTREAVRIELGVAADRCLVVMVGHLRRWKGHALVLDALRTGGRALQEKIVVAFAGGAPSDDRQHADDLRARAAAEGLTCVRFLGERTDAADIMAAADVALHASTSPEPFGLVLVEAMILGRPVVASALGGPLEIVTPESGLLFDPTDPGALAALLGRLADDPALRAALGAAGRRRADEFTIARTTSAIEAMYDELLEDGTT